MIPLIFYIGGFISGVSGITRTSQLMDRPWLCLETG